MKGEGRATLTVKAALVEAANSLRRAGIEDARREAGLLLSRALNRDRTFLITYPEKELSYDECVRFREWTARRTLREPLQYITGYQEFFGLDFAVTRDVLIPRPETELIVEASLKLLRENSSPFICDIGTGTGCIIVSLLHELRNARGYGVDISTAALSVAALNARQHKIHSRLSFIACNCFDAFADCAPQFSLIVSNPPYIDEAEVNGLQPEVRLYEPRAALTPGVDGLSMIRRLLRDAPRHLESSGYLIFEIGYGQYESVTGMIDRSLWTLVEIMQDLRGIPRTVVLKLCG